MNIKHKRILGKEILQSFELFIFYGRVVSGIDDIYESEANRIHEKIKK